MRNYFIALCILLFAGCTKADVESVSQQKINSQKFHAEFAEEDTRTFVDEKVRLLWTEGDLLTIFTSTLNRKYQFDGETGDNSGTFSEIATSQFGTGNSISANYAVYPYSSSNKISNDEVLTLSLPATQKYAEGSFGQDANTMVAVTSEPNDYFLPFKNVGGFLRLRLYGEGVTVKSIELKGNNSEKIAGKVTVTTKYGQNPELEMSASATESITLECGDGVALGATAAEAKDFWIVVPPTTFSKGFTITITDTAGATMEKSTTKSYAVERNVLKSMTAFEVEILDANTPPNNQIWYTSSDGKIITPANAFGANIISNVYENGKGVITFDDSVTQIGISAFELCNTLTDITIPNSVTSIAYNAFVGCAITNITIPDNVTYIDGCAFIGCDKLSAFYGKFASSDNRCLIINSRLTSFAHAGITSYTIPEGVTSIGFAAFQWSPLKSVTIPESVTDIGEQAFIDCEALTSVYCKPINPPTVQNYSFMYTNCKIYVPKSSVDAYKSADVWKEYADRIVGYDFEEEIIDANTPPNNQIWYTSSDGKIITPANAFEANIISNVYENGKGVITFDDSVTQIGYYAFELCNTLTDITIPNSVTSIAYSAFVGCAITNVTIPDNVTYIGTYAFFACDKLSAFYGKFASSDNRCLIINSCLTSFAPAGITSYTIPEGVTSIGWGVFQRSPLKSVTIPESVTDIESQAFLESEALASVYCKPINPPTMQNSNIFMYTNCIIYVPKSSVDAYKSADIWKEYADRIVGYDFR